MQRPRVKFCVWVPILTSLLFIFLIGCKRQSHQTQASKLEPIQVSAVKIQKEKRQVYEEVVGTVRPRLSAVVSAKIVGTIIRMDAADGKIVRAGDLIAEIDAGEIRSRFNQAAAIFDQASADMVRFNRLFEQKVITQQEFDAAKTRLDVAKAALDEARTMLDYTKIVAPFDGVITKKYVDVGNLATAGKPLFELEGTTGLRLEADVPEALIDKIRIGDRVKVILTSISKTLEGTIDEISPAADPMSRTFLVKVSLPMVDGLKSGLFGRLAIPVTEVNTIQIPRSSVFVRGQMETVMVIKNGIAQLRLIKTGKVIGENIEVVSGLEEGELIVKFNDGKLAEGQPVQLID
jgi:RND family efflux transporter MFP subunit